MAHSSSIGNQILIVACGPAQGSLVYAITVVQPVQTWTVLRSHDDFQAASLALAGSFPNLPGCPTLGQINSVSDIARQRNAMQQWLSSVVMHPGVAETPAFRNFLTVMANEILPQYENVAWTQFNSQQEQRQKEQQQQHHQPQAAGNIPLNVDDMEMADMFYDGGGPEEDDEDVLEEDDEFPKASERYKLLDEAISDEDEMDFMQIAGEVEMVDDVGSLAQSLGASHLGRSLKLQQEMGSVKRGIQNSFKAGLKVGGTGHLGSAGGGGIAGAMANATLTAGTSMGETTQAQPSATRLDQFKMIKVIGKGSFGKVFLVKEIKTESIFALKVLRKDNIIKRNQVEHTKTERSVLGSINHPFIVGMRMAFQSKDKLYFVLDYCAGGELFFHLGKVGKFPEPRARFYTAEIVLAISYVHGLDVIYRDLKPENVLLTADGHIRLTDFGLSKEGISGSSSGAHSFCGTPEYLAPEILNRQGHGRAVDWWSLGALLYEMITGLPPFYCQDRERLFEKIRKSELPYPATVSPIAKSLLKGLLTKDPTRRLGSGPTDAEDIKTNEFFGKVDWDALAAGQVTPPWRPNITSQLDTSQFDKEFTNMPVFSPHSVQRSALAGSPGNAHFEGFTFTDKSFQDKLLSG